MQAWLRRLPIAHRGLHGACVPENSLAAFEAAVAAGVAIELDVRLSSDGVPVVFHDETLGRMTGIPGRMAARTASELTDLRLGGTDEHVPTLAQALDRIGGRMPVLVEIKRVGRTGEQAIARVLSERAVTSAVHSFDPLAVRRIKRLLPGLPCGLIAASSERLVIAMVLRPDFIAYDVRKASCRLARRAASTFGWPLLVWTVRTRADHAAAAALGANIIFEDA